MRVAPFLLLMACNYSPPRTTGGDAPLVDAPPVDMPVDVPVAFWDNVVSAATTGNNLKSTSATAAWNTSGAVTHKTLTRDGYLEFTTAESNLGKAFGLSNGDTNQDFRDIDFGIVIDAGGNVAVIE